MQSNEESGLRHEPLPIVLKLLKSDCEVINVVASSNSNTEFQREFQEHSENDEIIANRERRSPIKWQIHTARSLAEEILGKKGNCEEYGRLVVSYFKLLNPFAYYKAIKRNYKKTHLPA